MSSVLPTGVLASIAVEITTVTQTGVDEITVALSDISDDVNVSSIPSATNAEGTESDAHNSVTATDVQTALEQLADQHWVQSSTPSGSNLAEGDLWYNTSTDQLKCYIQVSGGYEWRALAASGYAVDVADSLMSYIDGGTF